MKPSRVLRISRMQSNFCFGELAQLMIPRHNAHAFVYVLEGSIVMQLKGGKEVTLRPGQTFYEGPDDVHIVGRSADKTKPAKFVVFLIKDKGAPVLVPVK